MSMQQQVQSQQPASRSLTMDSAPPFLPLEEMMQEKSGSVLDDISMGESTDDSDDANDYGRQEDLPISKKNDATTFSTVSSSLSSRLKLPDVKQISFIILGGFFIFILWESFFVEADNRLIQPEVLLVWVESNPGWGLGAILIVIAAAVVSLLPIGTPLTLGCGYIYRGVYGWKLGLFVSTVISMAGSLLGAVTCFLLGRYLMRDKVKRWVRNYPLFDAIDVAVSEQGLKIMAMLYLTPVLPLGLVSYMCGTTAMDIRSFALAKIASLPLYLMYTFMGASAHSFIKGGKGSRNTSDISKSVSDEALELEENQILIVSGLVLSVVMMTLITRNIHKELMKILDQQKKDKGAESTTPDDSDEEETIEMGLTSRRKNNSKNLSK